MSKLAQFYIYTNFSDETAFEIKTPKDIDYSANEIVRLLRRYADYIEIKERQACAGLDVLHSLRNKKETA